MNKILMFLGVVLVICSVLVFVFPDTGISYTQKEKIAEVAGIEITSAEDKLLQFTPIIGGIMFVLGVGLVLLGRKNK